MSDQNIDQKTVKFGKTLAATFFFNITQNTVSEVKGHWYFIHAY